MKIVLKIQNDVLVSNPTCLHLPVELIGDLTDANVEISRTVSVTHNKSEISRPQPSTSSYSTKKRKPSWPSPPSDKRRTSSNRCRRAPESYDSAAWEFDEDDEKVVNGGIVIPSVRFDEIYMKYYIQAFSRLGQLACREVATTWIKWCHPKKQSRCPYKNRGQTKPDYWPSSDYWRIGLGCRHIEPAHLKKSGQLAGHTMLSQMLNRDRTFVLVTTFVVLWGSICS